MNGNSDQPALIFKSTIDYLVALIRGLRNHTQSQGLATLRELRPDVGNDEEQPQYDGQTVEGIPPAQDVGKVVTAIPVNCSEAIERIRRR